VADIKYATPARARYSNMRYVPLIFVDP